MNMTAWDLFPVDSADPIPVPNASKGGGTVRRDAAINRERLVKAADVGPATLYRRFANKDALVQEVLSGFFQRLIDLAEEADQAPAQECLDVFLATVGVELAEKAGLSAPVWGELAPEPLVEELRRRSAALLARAQESEAVRADVLPADIQCLRPGGKIVRPDAPCNIKA